MAAEKPRIFLDKGKWTVEQWSDDDGGWPPVLRKDIFNSLEEAKRECIKRKEAEKAWLKGYAGYLKTLPYEELHPSLKNFIATFG